MAWESFRTATGAQTKQCVTTATTGGTNRDNRIPERVDMAGQFEKMAFFRAQWKL